MATVQLNPSTTPFINMARKKKKSINDLPLELLREILLKLSVKSLFLLKRVSKTWLHLISDPNFAKSHFELDAAPTRRLFNGSYTTGTYDLDALFHKDYAPSRLRLPRCMTPCFTYILGSCRGLIMLDQCPYLIIWNPSHGAHRRISYSHIAPLSLSQTSRKAFLYGFGYDASKDDYLLVLAWRDKNLEGHFDFFSVKTNSWKSYDVALPNTPPTQIYGGGFFFNGALHWLAKSLPAAAHSSVKSSPIPHCYDPMLVFYLKERSFSEILLPKPLTASVIFSRRVMELEGCLALLFWSPLIRSEIWVMKEYKVQSSWTCYGNFGIGFNLLGESNDGNIVGFEINRSKFSKYSVSGDKIEHSCYLVYVDDAEDRNTVCTDSLISPPNDSGQPDCQDCSVQLDAVKKRRRIRRATTWTRDFYCY